jgi:RNA polymerase sigma factor (sigma-70 family)
MASEQDEGAISDAVLWERVRQRSATAFEAVVRRHQTLVCSVAYSIVGDLALSEDIAQETFWTAWRDASALERPERLGAWWCGIARNVARNVLRKSARPGDAAQTLDHAAEPVDPEAGPSEQVVSREEQTLVWSALERIPETYREPLVLFYREDRSVSQTAAALELTEHAVKQRLSRGRAMLREQVAEIVENGLRRTRPGRTFTVGVMAGLTASGVGMKTAVAAGATTGMAKAAAGGFAGAAGGAVGGVLGGLAGSWLGGWVPAQMAPTVRERDLYLRAARRMLMVSFPWIGGFIVFLWARPRFINDHPIAWFVWLAVFQVYLWAEGISLSLRIRRGRAEAQADDIPNPAALRRNVQQFTSRYRGRVYRSQATLLGLPLLDIHVSDPMGWASDASGGTAGGRSSVSTARGWIAVGDDARAVLLAFGSNTAWGLIAASGRAIGVFSFGGAAVGLVACGGVGVGLIGVGGLGVGIWAIGGGAIGWQAFGGGSLGWELACGGMAMAKHAAFGGVAIAQDYAVGGTVQALHANDAQAKAFILNLAAVRTFQTFAASVRWLTLLPTVSIGLSVIGWRVMYRRVQS